MIYGVLITIISLFYVLLPAVPKMHSINKPPKRDVKGIYMTAYTAGWKERRAELFDMIESSELNSVVIDMKDSTGRIFFDSNVKLANEIGSEDLRIPDVKGLIQELKAKDIYTIARVAIFQDPWLAEHRQHLALKRSGGGLWRDYKGLAWVDSTSREVWKYNIDIIKEVIDLGFDEINMDYIRFPSDGNLNTIEYPFFKEDKPKTEAMKEFFEYVDNQLAFSPVYTSVDLFGMVLVRDDGLGIGQRFQDAAPHFDYIAPMVYPSHYPDGFEGYQNPALYPYEIISYSLDKAKEGIKGMRAAFRPWIQDFDLGATYTPALIRRQMQATYDSGWSGWMLWNASNRYTEGALEPQAVLGSEIDPSSAEVGLPQEE